MALDPITAIFDGVTTVVNKIWPDATQSQKDAFAFQLSQLQAETDLAKGQLAINAEEAKSDSLFVAGWRPFIGWVCGTAFAYHFIAQPLIVFLLAIGGRVVALPQFDMSTLITVLVGLLGLGGLRTYEKKIGVS